LPPSAPTESRNSTGLFDQRALDRFLTRLFSTPGRSNDFRKLDHKRL
jgi:hypothetical protein